jgi:N-acetylmuramoyl-L-alanine amidase
MRNVKLTGDLRQLILLLVILAVPGLCLWPDVSPGQGPGKKVTVIVDPGHGGQDTGGKGPGGVLEKELTLSLARKTAEVLEDTGRVRPVLTRTDDYTISLDDRAGAANHRGGDLLVSLHVGNAFQPVPLGFSLYYWSPVTAPATMSPDSNQGLPWDQEQRPYLASSRRLAALVEQQLLGTLPWPTGGVLQADLYLLRRVRMPAVLVELGSLNHPGEADEMQKPEFQEAVARALAEAIVKNSEKKGEEMGERSAVNGER